jgi:hypothetical protein
MPPRASKVWSSIEERLMSDIAVTNDGSCWLWKGGNNGGGYGQFMWKGERYLAHRLMYEIHKGPIAKGMFCCHTCDVPACCNPDHLYEGTAQDNVCDAVRRGRHRPRYFYRDLLAELTGCPEGAGITIADLISEASKPVEQPPIVVRRR